MKKIGVVLIVFIFLSCQKNNENKSEFQEIEPETYHSSNENSDNSNAVKNDDNTSKTDTAETSSEQIVEKLPKIKPVEYSQVTSEADLWSAYNQARDEITQYKENGDFDSLLISLNKAASIAQKLNRPDIASWQYNNIGFYSINEFKKRTDYASRMKDLEIMPYGDEKVLYVQETKDKINSELDLLKSARESLYDAMELNNQSPDKNREKIIDSNLQFVNSIFEFLN